MELGNAIVNILESGSRGALNTEIYAVKIPAKTDFDSGATLVSEIQTPDLAKDATGTSSFEVQIDTWVNNEYLSLLVPLANAIRDDLDLLLPDVYSNVRIKGGRMVGQQPNFEEDTNRNGIRQDFRFFVEL